MIEPWVAAVGLFVVIYLLRHRGQEFTATQAGLVVPDSTDYGGQLVAPTDAISPGACV